MLFTLLLNAVKPVQIDLHGSVHTVVMQSVESFDRETLGKVLRVFYPNHPVNEQSMKELQTQLYKELYHKFPKFLFVSTYCFGLSFAYNLSMLKFYKSDDFPTILNAQWSFMGALFLCLATHIQLCIKVIAPAERSIIKQFPDYEEMVMVRTAYHEIESPLNFQISKQVLKDTIVYIPIAALAFFSAWILRDIAQTNHLSTNYKDFVL